MKIHMQGEANIERAGARQLITGIVVVSVHVTGDNVESQMPRPAEVEAELQEVDTRAYTCVLVQPTLPIVINV
jgi:hypothetical protein